MNSKIWENLSKYFNDEINIQKQYHEMPFSPHLYEFKGILNYLQKLSNGNIKNEISIKSSEVIANCIDPYNVVVFDSNSFFESQSDVNSFLEFNFKKRRVKPTYYTIRSYPYKVGENHPRNWEIKGSNDYKNWETISEERNNSYLNGKSNVHTFSINKPNSNYYQFIRIKTLGENWFSEFLSYRLAIDSFEIYGTLLNNCVETII